MKLDRLDRFILTITLLYMLAAALSACGTPEPAKSAAAAQTAASPGVAQGPKGDTGPAGPTGPAGKDGQSVTGPAGANGKNGLSGNNAENLGCYREDNDQYIGIGIGGCNRILFSDGAVADFTVDGKADTDFGYVATGTPGVFDMPLVCAFTDTTCSGACYATFPVTFPGTGDVIRGLYKNEVFYSALGGFVKATGKESDAVGISMNSYYDWHGCHVASWDAADSFLVNTKWTPPVTLSLPLGELYEGVGQ